MKKLNKKGVTLITLVVIMIVIMILTGVIVSVMSDEDKDIIDMSKEVRSSTEEKQEREILEEIFFEIQNKEYLKNAASLDQENYIKDSLNDIGVKNYELFSTYIKIESRTYDYNEFLPGFELNITPP